MEQHYYICILYTDNLQVQCGSKSVDTWIVDCNEVDLKQSQDAKKHLQTVVKIIVNNNRTIIASICTISVYMKT